MRNQRQRTGRLWLNRLCRGVLFLPVGLALVFLPAMLPTGYAGAVEAAPELPGMPQDQNGLVTRAAVAELMAKFKGLPGRWSKVPTFTDVGPDQPVYAAIEAAVQAGLLHGYPDGCFDPDRLLTRAEAAVLLCRLAGRSGADQCLPGDLPDVSPHHWAWPAIATVVANRWLPETENGFNPTALITKDQMVKGVAAFSNLTGTGVAVRETGLLVPLAGVVYLKPADKRDFVRIKAPTPCEAGATIKTGSGGRAGLTFADGSGLRLENDTVLRFKKAAGRQVVWQGWQEGVIVDELHLFLQTGRVLGVLAAPGFALPGGAVVETPWGRVTVSGVLWMNEVGSGGEVTNVIYGTGTVKAGESQVDISAGWSTTVLGPGKPPVKPGPMTAAEKQVWQGVTDWVKERLALIAAKRPILYFLPPGMPEPWPAGVAFWGNAVLPDPFPRDVIQAAYTKVLSKEKPAGKPVRRAGSGGGGGGGSGGSTGSSGEVPGGQLNYPVVQLQGKQLLVFGVVEPVTNRGNTGNQDVALCVQGPEGQLVLADQVSWDVQGYYRLGPYTLPPGVYRALVGGKAFSPPAIRDFAVTE